jgi:hypothetical protein
VSARALELDLWHGTYLSSFQRFSISSSRVRGVAGFLAVPVVASSTRGGWRVYEIAADVRATRFFRLPAPGKRDPFFGRSRGWYYKAQAAGEIRMITVRQRGVRLVAYDFCAYIRRAAQMTDAPVQSSLGLATE